MRERKGRKVHRCAREKKNKNEGRKIDRYRKKPKKQITC